MIVKNIEELFAHDGRDFVAEAYRNLLKREPDDHGLMYYMGRMAQGHSKADIIAQLAKSPECRPLDEIDGLKRLTVDVKRSSGWLMRWFERRGRMEGAVYLGTLKLAQLDTQLASMNQHLASLQDALRMAANGYTQQMENLVQQVSQMQSISPTTNQFYDKPQPHSSETIAQAYVDIMGHPPEPGSVEIIDLYAKFETPQALREALMASAEFQAKVAVLSEYARNIFQRQIQMVKHNPENNSCA